jgi:hypothetical protein
MRRILITLLIAMVIVAAGASAQVLLREPETPLLNTVYDAIQINDLIPVNPTGQTVNTVMELQPEDSLVVPVSQKKKNNLYSDKSTSTFEIFKNDTTGGTIGGYFYKAVEVNYKIVYIRPEGYKYNEKFIAKYTTTTEKFTEVDDQKRNIKVDIQSFEQPSTFTVKIDKNCDKIELLKDVYKTEVFPCCAIESKYEIFDYKNKSIIQADRQIITGVIPPPADYYYNSQRRDYDIKFYVGFKKYRDVMKGKSDAAFIGSLNYSYSSTEKYSIKIRSKNEEDYDCDFSPEIELLYDEKTGSFDDWDKEYKFWALRDISDINSINNLTVRLKFLCSDTVIDIPIINGKPFGKEDKIQELSIPK